MALALLALNVAMAMSGTGHAVLHHSTPTWHRPGRQSAALAAMAMRGSGAQKLMLSTATVDVGVDGWRWRDGTGRALTFEKLVSETKEAHDIRQNVQVRMASLVRAAARCYLRCATHFPSAAQVHIGCDSAVSRERVTFAVVVCVVSVGHAGRYFYARLEQSLHTVPVLQTRLLREVELALSTAQELTEHGVDIVRVHVDSNTEPGCSSTEHTKMLTGYVSAMGYTCLVKPEAWANFVADRHSRGNVHHVRRSALVSSQPEAPRPQKKSAGKVRKGKVSAPPARRAKAR
jgi:predicted RNase H-related nuclease YkuK (DUF458 family)